MNKFNAIKWFNKKNYLIEETEIARRGEQEGAASEKGVGGRKLVHK